MSSYEYDCSKLLNHLMLYLDKELSEEDQQAVLTHLKKCPKCFKHFEQEQAIRQCLQGSCKCKCADDELKKYIKQVIQEQFNASSAS